MVQNKKRKGKKLYFYKNIWWSAIQISFLFFFLGGGGFIMWQLADEYTFDKRSPGSWGHAECQKQGKIPNFCKILHRKNSTKNQIHFWVRSRADSPRLAEFSYGFSPTLYWNTAHTQIKSILYIKNKKIIFLNCMLSYPL